MIIVKSGTDFFMFEKPSGFELIKEDYIVAEKIRLYVEEYGCAKFSVPDTIFKKGKIIYENKEPKLQYFYLSYVVGMLKLFYETLYPSNNFEKTIDLMRKHNHVFITKRKAQMHNTFFNKNLISYFNVPDQNKS